MKSPTHIEPLMCSLLRTDPKDDQNPHRPAIRKLLTLTYQKSEASAMPPNPATLAKKLQESFPEVTSIMPHRHRTCLQIEVPDEVTYQALLRITEIDNIPISIRDTNHELGISKGTIDLTILPNMSETELLGETKDQGVLEVRQIVRSRNDKNSPTNLFLLTFNTQEPPHKLKVDHLSLHVDSRIPNPLRCFGCQWYGHTADQCLRDPVCARCSQPGHDSKNCQETPLCFHCRSDHPTFDRSCPMYRIEKLILEKRFKDKVPFKEARQQVYLNHPDLTQKIPRLTQKKRFTPSEKPGSQSGKTYSQATGREAEASKDTHPQTMSKEIELMIDTLIHTVDKQQQQIELLIDELREMKVRHQILVEKSAPPKETHTQTFSWTETKDAATQTTSAKPQNRNMEAQTPSCQKVTDNAATQTPHFDPNAPLSSSSLSFLTETKIDDTLALETSCHNESEAMDSEDATRSKRKCISPIEAPKPDPTSPTNSNLQLSFTTVHESIQDTSLTNGMNVSYSHSDFAVDYRDFDTQDPTQESENVYKTEDTLEDQDTDSKEGNEEPTFRVVQAFFFSKEIAQKMNATEIKATVNQYFNGPAVCSVLQLENPHGGHFIYLHSVPEGIELPSRLTILPDIKVILEEPRKKIDKWCDCPEVGVITHDKLIIFTNPKH